MDGMEDRKADRHEFIGVLSHELRTPLNAIVCIALVLEQDTEEGVQVCVEARRIEGYAHQIADVVTCLMASLEDGPLASDHVEWGAATAAVVAGARSGPCAVDLAPGGAVSRLRQGRV